MVVVGRRSKTTGALGLARVIGPMSRPVAFALRHCQPTAITMERTDLVYHYTLLSSEAKVRYSYCTGLLLMIHKECIIAILLPSMTPRIHDHAYIDDPS